MTIEY